MCEPVSVSTALLATSTALKVGSEAADYIGNKKAAKANEKAANAALEENLRQLDLRKLQETDATQLEEYQAGQQATSAAAQARVAAGTAGVAGNSVDAVIQGIQRDAANFNALSEKNLGMTLAQLDEEKKGAVANARARIAQIPRPSILSTGLRIAGAGVEYVDAREQRKPK